jgi:putative ABC transport system permease protein
MAIFRRMTNLFRRTQVDREIAAELDAHIAMRVEANLAHGMTPEEARRDALLRFGNRSAAREHVAREDAMLAVEGLLADGRYAMRQLRRAPGFAATAILTLALGIGANTAIFSVTSNVLLRPLGYPRSDRIVQLEKEDGANASYSASIPLFLEWRNHNQVFQQIAAYSVLPVGFNLAEAGRPERVPGLRVSADFFRVLGIAPQLGRNFAAEDDREGAQPVVILSDGLWQHRYRGDRAIIGKQVSLDGETYTVIAVLPQGFQFLATLPTSKAIEVWTPLRLPAASRDPSNTLESIARLKDGVSPEQAGAALTTLSRQFAEELHPAFSARGTVALHPLQQRIAEDVRPTLLLLLGATGFVLLIACANVANLFAVRVAERSRELAVRASLGAGRLRLVRQLMTESLVIAICGGIAGFAVAEASMRILLAMAPLSIARFGSHALDWRVLLFATAASLATGLLFGVLPAMRSMKMPSAAVLQAASSRRTTRGREHNRLSGTITVVETALSLVLLSAAGLLIESFVRVQQVNPGFNERGLTTFETTLPVGSYGDRTALARFIEGVRQSIGRLPGVGSVASVSTLPTEPTLNAPFTKEDGPAPPPGEASGESDDFLVSADYFRTLRIPVLEGRAIDLTDRGDSPGVVVINQTMARRFWPGLNPIGKRIVIGKNLGPTWADEPREVVGVVGDARSAIDEAASPSMYTPVTQVPPSLARLLIGTIPVRWVVRTAASAPLRTEELEGAVLNVDSAVPVAEVRPMSELLGDALARWRFNMVLLSAFAGVALALAAIGIYGVVSYTVAQRTQEIGIRMALGANRRAVLGMVLSKGMRLSLGGALMGMIAALGLTRLMHALLFDVSPNDPGILCGVSVLLVSIAAIACLIPARRAARVDPMQALRSE